MVLFLFVVMMLDINLERVREGFWRNLPLALVVGGIMVWEMITILAFRYFGVEPRPIPPDYSNQRHPGRAGRRPLHRLRPRLRGGGGDPAGGDRLGDRPPPAPAQGQPPAGSRAPGAGAARGARAPRFHAGGKRAMSLSLNHYLVLGAVLFAISVVGIFLNRRNIIVLLMAIELMLLAVN